MKQITKLKLLKWLQYLPFVRIKGMYMVENLETRFWFIFFNKFAFKIDVEDLERATYKGIL